jgi:hypothetical protein
VAALRECPVHFQERAENYESHVRQGE